MYKVLMIVNMKVLLTNNLISCLWIWLESVICRSSQNVVTLSLLMRLHHIFIFYMFGLDICTRQLFPQFSNEQKKMFQYSKSSTLNISDYFFSNDVQRGIRMVISKKIRQIMLYICIYGHWICQFQIFHNWIRTILWKWKQ